MSEGGHLQVINGLSYLILIVSGTASSHPWTSLPPSLHSSGRSHSGATPFFSGNSRPGAHQTALSPFSLAGGFYLPTLITSTAF
ncbi:hypothetical protein EDB84DRAFT_1484067 [Lactarius hengduanensis]|nr:hypothetical protein EDB84DRAFT_1484067 [Lactarius hengduanensis]